MTRRRLPTLTFIGINIIVSVVTTILVLLVWDSRREPQTIVLPTFSGVSSEDGAPSGGVPVDDPAGEAAEPAPVGGQETGDSGVSEPPPVAEATVPGPPGNILHVVQPGEVLFDIAVQYDVTIEDIVIANGMESPDVLDVGQELIIPIGGLPPTSTPTVPPPTPTVELSPIATVTPPPVGAIEVSIDDVLFPGDVTREAVVIVNDGSPVDMEGWVLSDSEDNEFVFPSFRLFGNGSAVTIHTGVGEDEAGDLYWGRSTAVWGEASDSVLLRNPSGELQSEFPIEQ